MKRLIKNSGALFVLLLISCVLMLTGTANAREVTEQEVMAAIRTWVRHVTADARPDAEVERVERYIKNGTTYAYIVHLAGGGYCVSGADDLVYPVYLYSPEANYDPSHPAIEDILSGLEARQKEFTERAVEAASAVTEDGQVTGVSGNPDLWQALISWQVPEKKPKVEEAETAFHSASSDSSPDTVVLPLTSAWNQWSPYNDEAPVLVPGTDQHAATGCTATAASQIMYYWKWPRTSTGGVKTGTYPRRHSTDWVEEPFPSDPGIPSQFAATSGQGSIYEWVSTGGGKLRMRGYWDVSVMDKALAISNDSDYRDTVRKLFYDRLDSADVTLSVDFDTVAFDWDIMENEHKDPPGPGDEEVAKVMKHNALAIELRYGRYLTSGNQTKIPNAFTTYYRYDPDIYAASLSVEAMTEEMTWMRPVILGGCAHDWVVYGYNKLTDPHRQFLMGMGWGPGTNAHWYTVDGTPENWCDNPVVNTLRIAPKNVVKFVGNVESGDGSPDNPYENIEEALSDVPDNTKLILRAGSVNTFSSSSLLFDRPMTLKGSEVIIRKDSI